MRRPREMSRARAHLIAWLSFLIILFVSWTASYFLTNRIFTANGWSRSSMSFHLADNGIAVVIIAIILFTAGHLMRHKRSKPFELLNNSIRRIAKGDFKVSMEKPGPGNPFGELIESINHMAVELGQLERMRQEFISNVSHEFQSPLTSIGGFARALQSDNLDPDARRHYLEIIEAESRRLSHLSDNLLKLTSLESDHHPFEPRPYRLDRQLRSLLLVCEPQWSGKGLDVGAGLEEVVIHADEELLSQVWMNLFNNSIKFTPQGGTLAVSLKQAGETAVVSISDSGIGICDADKDRIFERFFKADPSRNRGAGGNGLGLSIVKKIVDMHGGTIGVDSAQGQGTIMTVSLPILSKTSQTKGTNG